MQAEPIGAAIEDLDVAVTERLEALPNSDDYRTFRLAHLLERLTYVSFLAVLGWMAFWQVPPRGER